MFVHVLLYFLADKSALYTQAVVDALYEPMYYEVLWCRLVYRAVLRYIVLRYGIFVIAFSSAHIRHPRLCNVV